MNDQLELFDGKEVWCERTPPETDISETALLPMAKSKDLEPRTGEEKCATENKCAAGDAGKSQEDHADHADQATAKMIASIAPETVYADDLDDDNDLEDDLDPSQLFPTEGGLDLSAASQWLNRRDALAIHYEIEEQVGKPVDVVFTNNRRRMLSTRLVKDRHLLRMHHVFALSDPETIRGIVWILIGDRNQKAAGRLAIRKFLTENAHLVTDSTMSNVTLQTKGRYHDLRESLSRVRDIALDIVARITPPEIDLHNLPKTPDPLMYGELNLLALEPETCKITWGRNGRRGNRSIRMGSYEATARLIRIHPALDRQFVPQDFVDFVVYHEFLHHILPTRIVGARRVVHSRTFRALESRFPDFEKLLLWERANVEKIMRS